MFLLFTSRCLHVRHDVRDPSGGSGNCGRKCCPVILPKWRLPRHLGIFYMPQIYDGFTSPPKEGVLRIFSPLKIRRLRPGLNPRTWVLKASTLPLDHRSRCDRYIITYSLVTWCHMTAGTRRKRSLSSGDSKRLGLRTSVILQLHAFWWQALHRARGDGVIVLRAGRWHLMFAVFCAQFLG